MDGEAWYAAVHEVTTERLHFHFSLSCIGEGNADPLQCSCLENPRDGGAWWASVYGVAQSRTRLKRLSSSIKCVISCKNQVVISEIEKSKYGKTAERNKKDNSNIAKRELDSLGIVIVLRL